MKKLLLTVILLLVAGCSQSVIVREPGSLFGDRSRFPHIVFRGGIGTVAYYYGSDALAHNRMLDRCDGWYVVLRDSYAHGQFFTGLYNHNHSDIHPNGIPKLRFIDFKCV